jgi:hypothetical protein
LSWVALDLTTRPVTRRTAWVAGTAGALLQWFSLPSVLVAVGLTLPIALWASTTPPDVKRRRVGVVVGMWAASAAAITIVTVTTMSPETRDYMRVYWADGFAPASLADWVRTGWPWPRIHRLFRGGFGAQAGLGYPLPPFYPALAIMGFVLLWRRDRRLALILLAPLAVTLAAATMRQYPFSDRLIVFLVPAALIAIGEVSGAVARVTASYSKPIAALAVASITVPALLPVATKLPPYRVEDIKFVLGYVQARHQPTDEMYVYYAAAPVMTTYASQFGFNPPAYVVGGCHRGATRRYFEELDAFRGHSRVWVILTHSQPVYREREDMLAYLDAIGTRLDYVDRASRVVGHTPFSAEGFLYDLSATARLAAADSASFTVTGPTGTNQQNTCRNGPHAMIRSDFVCPSPQARCARRGVP